MTRKKEESFAELTSKIFTGRVGKVEVKPYSRRKSDGKNKVVHVKGYWRKETE